MGASVAPVEVRFTATGIDAVRQGLRSVRDEAKGVGEAAEGISHSAVIGIGELTRGLGRIADTGQAGAFAMRELSGGVMRFASALGPAGGLVGVLGLAGGAIYEVFAKAREEMQKTQKEFNERLDEMGKSASVAGLAGRTGLLTSLKSGDRFASIIGKNPNESDAQFTARSQGIDGLLKLQRHLESQTVTNYDAKTGLATSVLPRDPDKLKETIALIGQLSAEYERASRVLNVVLPEVVSQNDSALKNKGDRTAATLAEQLRALQIGQAREHAASLNRIAGLGAQEAEDKNAQMYRAGLVTMRAYYDMRESLARQATARELADVEAERARIASQPAPTVLEAAKRASQLATITDQIKEIEARGAKDIAAIHRDEAAEEARIESDQTAASVRETIKRTDAAIAAYKSYQDAINKLRGSGLTAGGQQAVSDKAYQKTQNDLPGVDVNSPEFQKALEANMAKLSSQLESRSQQIGQVFASSLATGIQAGLQAHSVGSAFASLGRSILAGLGGVMVNVGEQALAAMAFIKTISESLATLDWAVGFPAALGLIALGTILQGVAGSGGGGGSYSGGGASSSLPAIVNTGFLNSGNTPATRGAGVSQSKPNTNNIFVIGTDPKAWRQVQEQLDAQSRRG